MIRLMTLPLAALIALAPANAINANAPKDLPIVTGTGPICDTAEQMEMYISVIERDMQAAIKAVNDVHGDKACVVNSVAYVRGADIKTVNHKEGAVVVTRILVVGVVTPFGVVIPIEPASFFTVFEAEAPTERAI